MKSTVRLFMVPVYVKVGEEFDHAVTLAGSLRFMEDHCDPMFVDTDRMIDCGRQRKEDIPERLK